MTDFIYDIETFPNIFTVGVFNVETKEKTLFEISWRKHELKELVNFLSWLRSENHRMVGFNNIGFDYPVIHMLIEDHSVTALDLYFKAKSIINSKDKFGHLIWDNQRHVKQLDLYKIHHFDNAAKRTPLKVLEFNMRMDSVQDLPFEPGKLLNDSQCDTLISYMWHDIEATYQFYNESMKQIRFREELTEKYGRNFMDSSDVKIGTDIFIMELEKRLPDFNKNDRTHRAQIPVKDILIQKQWFQFIEPAFHRVHEWFKNQVITDTKKAFKDVECVAYGFTFDFGTGGLHGSIDPCIIEADDQFDIVDIDVKSYYPNIAITQQLYPEHLSSVFCDIYKDIYESRKQYTKTEYPTENLMYKLALNGSFGNTNNQYSPLYDPQVTMAITINGQLLICLLVEMIMIWDQVQLIQVNTDGLTIRIPKGEDEWLKTTCKLWEDKTGLTLEYANYSKMFIRDVNNYIAEYTTGDIKRKGAYEYDREWYQDHSALVVPKAVEAHLLHGADVRQFIEKHEDMHDFMLRTKVPRSSKLVAVNYNGDDFPQQNITRYYIAVMGVDLVKIMPPLKGKTEPRRIGINTGWKVAIANDITELIEEPDTFFNDVEYEWYIQEAMKLIRPLEKGI